VLASEYKLVLPSERTLQEEITKMMSAIRERLAAGKRARGG
jgi:hypothetical protein